MFLQLMQNVNISFEICSNVPGQSGPAAGGQRGHSGEAAGAKRGSSGGAAGEPRGSHGRDPLWTFLWDSYLPLLEPSSELAIREILVRK